MLFGLPLTSIGLACKPQKSTEKDIFSYLFAAYCQNAVFQPTCSKTCFVWPSTCWYGEEKQGVVRGRSQHLPGSVATEVAVPSVTSARADFQNCQFIHMLCTKYLLINNISHHRIHVMIRKTNTKTIWCNNCITTNWQLLTIM